MDKPKSQEFWDSYHSTSIIKEIFNKRMVPLNVKGIKEGTKILTNTNFLG